MTRIQPPRAIHRNETPDTDMTDRPSAATPPQAAPKELLPATP
ncbi:hypothetical protein [Neorhodopirellula lusitana]